MAATTKLIRGYFSRFHGGWGSVPVLGFADRLRSVRRLLGLSQEVFAFRIGITEFELISFEEGGRLPPIEAVESLVDEFGVSETWLVFGAGNVFLRSSAEASA